MTTISPKRRRRTFGSTGFIVTVFFVLILGLVAVLRPHVSSLFWQAAAPVLALRNMAAQTDASRLASELASTTAALADRNALYQENIQLKALLGRSVEQHSTLASVLMRPPGIPYDTLMIDIGAHAGVVPGALVFAGGSLVVGTVSDVYENTSRVVLLSSPGQTYQATLQNGTPVSLEGQGAGSMVGEVPAGTSVTGGEAVTLPGVLSSFVGSVSYINHENGSSFETLYVQLPVNVFNLTFVQVQTP